MSDTRKRKKGKAAESKQPESGVIRDVILWLSLAVCILLFLSSFGLGGKAGNTISRFLFGLFGAVNYVLPIGLLIGIFFAVSNKGNTIARIKLWAAFFFVISLDGIIDVIMYGKAVPSPARAYLISYRGKSGGGFFGCIIGGLFAKAFGSLVAGLLLVIFMIICIVLVTEKGLLSRFIDRDRTPKEEKKEPEKRERRKRRESDMIADEPEKKPAKKKRVFSGVTLIPSPEKEDSAPERHDGLRELTRDDLKEAEESTRKKPDDIPVAAEKEEVRLVSGQDVKTNIHIVDEPDPEPEPQPVPEPVKEVQKPQIHVAQPKAASDGIHEITEDVYDEPKTQPVQEEKKPDIDNAPIAMDRPSVPEREYVFPPVSLLKQEKQGTNANTQEYLQQTADKLATTLKNFGVDAQVTDVTCGPTVTRYEIHPEMGVKVSKIVNLADDIKLNLAAADIRIEAPIPGKSAVGIEVPNKHTMVVPFREMMESKEFQSTKSKIAFAAGRDIAGKVIVSDIAKMPHLLIAGATGSGKSVCINTIIMSILYKAKPSEVKFIMIDPKVVELSVYNGIPHLMTPVVTDPKKAAGALQWAVNEMTDRYKRFAETGVRDIKGYNARIKNGKIAIRDKNGESVMVNVEKMPQIVVIVDELADLMMQCPKEVEGAICRLAQLARACGIHLVIATQRPSVDVITGLIKANMPSRIAFAVTSGVDSRTILDMNGAEKLLGKGDMLYFPQGFTKPLRVQGAFVPDEDVSKVVDFIKKQNGGDAEYDSQIQESIEESTPSSESGGSDAGGDFNERDQYFADAGRLIIDKQKGSIGMLQRNFKIGFNRAARIMDQLEEAGVVGAETGTKPRTVLMTLEQFNQYLDS